MNRAKTGKLIRINFPKELCKSSVPIIYTYIVFPLTSLSMACTSAFDNARDGTRVLEEKVLFNQP